MHPLLAFGSLYYSTILGKSSPSMLFPPGPRVGNPGEPPPHSGEGVTAPTWGNSAVFFSLGFPGAPGGRGWRRKGERCIGRGYFPRAL